MELADLTKPAEIREVGKKMYELIAELYPICRSITGEGLRTTLRRLREIVPLSIHEIPSGTKVFDWTVPREWNISDAYIKDSRGRRVVDFKASNLHVVNYSVPVKNRMKLSELSPHLFSLPQYPEWIPYRTTYYSESWGFCLPHRQLQELVDDEYEVCIDSSLEDGDLSYGDYLIRGETKNEIIISTHVCHPSMCNDNLSGIALAAMLAVSLSSCPLRYSYRFLFVPGTIGSLCWLFHNEGSLANIRHGLVLACVGDRGPITYKRSRRHSAVVDRAVIHVLRTRGLDFKVQDFSPYGYDERQFCSPGFDLPVGSFRRTPHGEFPEYHTSADNLEFVSSEHLGDSFSALISVLQVLEENRKYVNLNPKGEPQLGKRGLYHSIGGKDAAVQELGLLWVLNLSDGKHSLLDIAERSGLPFRVLSRAASALVKHGLLEER